MPVTRELDAPYHWYFANSGGRSVRRGYQKSLLFLVPSCARAKANSLETPRSYFNRLPDPHRPWSHIAIDFVTRSARIPREIRYSHYSGSLFPNRRTSYHLTKLPSAKERAEIMIALTFSISMGFRLKSPPTGAHNSLAPFGKPFCTLNGAKPQLSSGFHPQTNGQTERP